MPQLESFKVLKKNQETPWGICLYLLDGPLTLDQIKTSYQNNPFPSSKQPSIYTKGKRHERRLEKLPEDLAKLIQAGWIKESDGLYSMTDLGVKRTRQEEAQALSYLQWMGQKLHSFVQPETASKATIAVQITLAVIKLPAGFLSGSVGLLNDSFDTILDLFSSLLVYLGIRFNRERLVSILLVVSMLITGCFTLYEAIHRFFTPFIPTVDWFPMAAASLSALAGLGLWTYQRYVGIHSGLMAFITESVDSRNHIIVALSVIAGLIASQLHFGLLDMLVGLAVALLILWSAIELVIDLMRSTKEGQIDLTHYGFWMQTVYQIGRQRYLQDWILNLVKCQEALTKAELVERVYQGTNFRDNPWMKAIGLDRPLVDESMIHQTLDEIIHQGWVIDQEPLLITREGEKYLERPKRIRQERRNRKKTRKMMPTLFLLIALISLLVIHFLLPVALIIPPLWNLLGIIPLVVGIYLNVVADQAFHMVNTTVKPFEESSVLVTNGVFRITRNPMYLGFVLILIGTTVLVRSLTPFLVVVAFTILIDRIYITVEERMLAQKFGREWENYRQRVRRWL